MESKHYKVVIIGSGPAGLTAAIYTARANLSPILIHGPLAGGQLTTTTDVENYPGFPEGVMGPELMERMEEQAKKFGTVILEQIVSSLELKGRPFTITLESGDIITADSVILATGANPRYLGIPGEKELLGYGVSTCATCDGAFFRNKVITVIGGGDSACEEANFLSKFGSKVFLIHRRDQLRASKIMQDRVFKNPKVEVLWNKVPNRVLGDKSNGVTGLELKDTSNGEVFELAADAMFVAIGHVPNSNLVKGVVDLDENGYIKPLRSHSTATNVTGLFACGDVQDHEYRQAITAAGSGCMAALEAERFLEAGE
jgi:thioredoxin reductase (NADPH)